MTLPHCHQHTDHAPACPVCRALAADPRWVAHAGGEVSHEVSRKARPRRRPLPSAPTKCAHLSDYPHDTSANCSRFWVYDCQLLTGEDGAPLECVPAVQFGRCPKYTPKLP